MHVARRHPRRRAVEPPAPPRAAVRSARRRSAAGADGAERRAGEAAGRGDPTLDAESGDGADEDEGTSATESSRSSADRRSTVRGIGVRTATDVPTAPTT